MRAPTRHPRLAAAACRIYRLVVWLYPAEFRRELGPELALTFRNRVEDVLDGGHVREWLVFAMRMGVDTIGTYRELLAARREQAGSSLLGLADGEAAQGGIEGATIDVALLFVAAGAALAVIGWYAFFAILPRYVS